MNPLISQYSDWITDKPVFDTQHGADTFLFPKSCTSSLVPIQYHNQRLQGTLCPGFKWPDPEPNPSRPSTLDAGQLAIGQYSEGPATGHLDIGFSWFPCVYKQMLRWFPTFQVATTCFSCSPPDLNLLVTKFIFCIHVK